LSSAYTALRLSSPLLLLPGPVPMLAGLLAASSCISRLFFGVPGSVVLALCCLLPVAMLGTGVTLSGPRAGYCK
jgi:hypothetical protein